MSTQTNLNLIRWCLYTVFFLVPLVFLQHMMFPFIILKTALLQTLVEVIFVLYVYLCLTDRKFIPRITPLRITLGVLLTILTVTAFTGYDVHISLWSGVSRAIGVVALWHFAILFLVLSCLWQEIGWKRLFLVSLGASVFAGGGALLSEWIPAVNHFFLEQGAGRPGSTFGNPTFLAGYLLFHVFIALIVLWEEKKGSVLWWCMLSCALINAFAVFRTQTRGDILGLIAGVFVIAVFFAFRRLFPFSLRTSILGNGWLFFLIVCVLFAGIFVATSHANIWKRVPGLARVTSLDTVKGELQYRFFAWGSALKAFREHPIRGWGWENFNIAFQRHYDPRLLTVTFGETFWDKPHNVYIEYAVMGGIGALIAYCALLFFVFWELARAHLQTTKPFLIAAVIAYSIRSFVIFDTIGTYLIFFLLIAYIDGVYASEHAVFSKKDSNRQGVSDFRMYGTIIAAIIAFVFVYKVNIPMVSAEYAEYGGPNYFILRQPENSIVSFEKALAAGSVYRDDTLINYAGVIKEGYAQGVAFPDIQNLQKKLVSSIEAVTRRHPADYFQYVYLAEFKNQFYQSDPSYLKDAEALEKKALELSPGRQQIYYAIAKTKLLEQDQPGAREAFQTAIDLNPKAGDPHFYLGLLAYQNGDFKTGRQELELARSLGRDIRTPEEAIALGNIAGDSEHDYKQAIEYFLNGLNVTKDTDTASSLKLKLGLAYYLDGSSQDAKRVFEDLGRSINFRTLSIFNDLEPILNSIGAHY